MFLPGKMLFENRAPRQIVAWFEHSPFCLLPSAFIVLLAFLISLAAVSTADAHGGGVPKLTNAEIGPYWISAWIQPDPPQVDDFHLTIALAEPGDSSAPVREAGPPILNALVEVQLRSLDRPAEVVSAFATHDNSANKLLYEADLVAPHAGRWEVVIEVVGPDGGSGTAGFAVEVVAASGFNIVWLLIGAPLIFFAAAFWMLRKTVISGNLQF